MMFDVELLTFYRTMKCFHILNICKSKYFDIMNIESKYFDILIEVIIVLLYSNDN